MKPTGFRRFTAGLIYSFELVEQWNADTAVQKRRAVLAFKRAAPLLHLSHHAIALMDKLFSFSQACDWQADTRPLVWPDNQRLLDQMNLSLSSLKRALRELANAGLLAFKDSPQGRRLGRRNRHTGLIDLERTYGLDLSPLGVRTPELEGLATSFELRDNTMRAQRRRHTVMRKQACAIIDDALLQRFDGPWSECKIRLEHLAAKRNHRASLEELTELGNALAALLERVRNAYSMATDNDADASSDMSEGFNLNPTGCAGDPLIQSTNQSFNSVSTEDNRCSAHAEPSLFLISDAGCASDIGLAERSADNFEAVTYKAGNTAPLAPEIDPQTLLALCPTLAEMRYLTGQPTWPEILRLVETSIKPTLRLPDSTWRAACRILGRERAAVAVSLIYEKFASGLVVNPGAYLNGMLTKAAAGSLNLSASLYYWRKTSGTSRVFKH